MSTPRDRLKRLRSTGSTRILGKSHVMRLGARDMLKLWLTGCFMLGLCQLNALADSNPGLQLKPRLGAKLTTYPGSIVSPDGSGLPTGSGTVAAGEKIYRNRCAACHGVDGKMPGNALVGGIGTLATARPLKTIGSYWPYATTLFDYIARAMPYDKPKSLSVDDTYAVVAYLLWLNGVLGSGTKLDGKGLVEVVMPNRGGFIELSPSPQ